MESNYSEGTNPKTGDHVVIVNYTGQRLDLTGRTGIVRRNQRQYVYPIDVFVHTVGGEIAFSKEELYKLETYE